MVDRVSRIGAWAGFVAVIGIVGYHLALTLLAGQRVSGVTDVSTVAAYYRQPIVAVLGVSQFLVVVPFLILVQALSRSLSRSEESRFFAGVARLAAAAQVAVILVATAAQVGLVAAADANQSVSGLYRYWDALYNSGLYALEATWVLGFGLALRSDPAFPRVLSWLSPLTAALLTVNVFAIWIGIPDLMTMPSALAIAVWLVAASIGLKRQSGTPMSDAAVAIVT